MRKFCVRCMTRRAVIGQMCATCAEQLRELCNRNLTGTERPWGERARAADPDPDETDEDEDWIGDSR